MRHQRKYVYFGLTASILSIFTMPAVVQAAETQKSVAVGGLEEVVVTARKREETSIAAPVILSAIGANELERRQIKDMDILARSIPQVMIMDSAGGVQGGIVAIRGYASPEQNPFVDQGVSFNIDGAPIANAAVRRMGQFDAGQVEVLKGPQTLYFGKNSPGGVISLTSKNPGSHFEAGAEIGYELEAHQIRGEGYISGPVSDSLGLRLAAYGSTMRGWNRNIGPQVPPFGPAEKWGPGTKEYGVRGTAVYKPSDRFDATLKLSYSHEHDNGSISATEVFYCPLGHQQNSSVGDCSLNHTFVRADGGPYISQLETKYAPAADVLFGNGVPYNNQNQFLGTLQANWHPSDQYTLTSVSSVWDNKFHTLDNFDWTADPVNNLASTNKTKTELLTQEFRLSTSYDFPLNFMVGVHGEKSSLLYQVRSSVSNTNIPTILTPGQPPSATNPVLTRSNDHKQFGTALSEFGEATWTITKEWELSGGGRYSWETKHYHGYNLGIEQAVFGPRGSWHNFSPEATLRWRPSQDLTLFASYKTGFLSGGYNSGSGTFGTTVASDRRYDQETVKGGEAGIKANLFDNSLRVNVGGYYYKIKGLQVGTIVAIPSLGTTAQLVSNAGGAHIEGFEADATWRPSVEGLELRGSIGYNNARYDDYLTTCWVGQTQALGCNRTVAGIVGPGTTANLQQLAGTQLGFAPSVTATLGATYEWALSSNLNAQVAVDGNYSSSFWNLVTEAPAHRTPSYALLDMTAKVSSADDGWALSVIGRNITNKLFVQRSTQVPFTGSGTGTAGVGIPGDGEGTVGRGREVWIRISKKM